MSVIRAGGVNFRSEFINDRNLSACKICGDGGIGALGRNITVRFIPQVQREQVFVTQFVGGVFNFDTADGTLSVLNAVFGKHITEGMGQSCKNLLFFNDFTAKGAVLTAGKTVEGTGGFTCFKGSNAVAVSTGCFLTGDFGKNAFISTDSLADRLCKGFGCGYGRFFKAEIVGIERADFINSSGIFFAKCRAKSQVVHDFVVHCFRDRITQIQNRTEVDDINVIVGSDVSTVVSRISAIYTTVYLPGEVILFIIAVAKVNL